jgi:hypothetical protein
MSLNIDSVFGGKVPELRPRDHLGVPDPEELVAHFLAEHGGDSGYRSGADGRIDGLVAFGGFDCTYPWPTDTELATARARIGEPY